MNEAPNHALQRTAPGVTVAASSHRLSPAVQLPRRAPQSLTFLLSFAVATRAFGQLPVGDISTTHERNIVQRQLSILSAAGGPRLSPPQIGLSVRAASRPLLLVQAPTPAPLAPEIAARLDGKWLADAKLIQSGEHRIFYVGSAVGSMSSDGKHWTGEIIGQILILSAKGAIACEKLRLSSTGGLSVEGSTQSQLVPKRLQPVPSTPRRNQNEPSK